MPAEVIGADRVCPMIYIVVRQTTEWGNEAVVRAQLPERIRHPVGLWNSTFALPYHVFRQELTRIAQINRSRIPGALCVPRAEVPAGATVVPTDDDDWFVPGLATTLESAPEGAAQWSTRLLARKMGMSQSAISRIWRASGLSPQRLEAVRREGCELTSDSPRTASRPRRP